MSVRFRLSVSRLFDRVSVSVDLVSVCDRVEISDYFRSYSTNKCEGRGVLPRGCSDVICIMCADEIGVLREAH